ncbi:MAG: hypothetical protein AMXMBFR13_50440 [Phycisphaerae bacterium]
MRLRTRRSGVLFFLAVLPAFASAEPTISFYRLRAPGDAHDVEQASGLHYGRLGEREGLWIVCDRNGRQSAGKLYHFSKATLARVQAGRSIVADEAFTVVLPRGEWSAFAAAHAAAGDDVLSEVHRRISPGQQRTEEPFLDLEAVTIAPAITHPHEPRVFVVAEEPHSVILELTLEGSGTEARARLVALYAYEEKADEQGTARNDGLEGLAWAGKPGRFYLAEEGTRSHTDEASALLFFRDPRLGVADLKAGRVQVDEKASDALTTAVRACRKAGMQTLNGLCVPSDTASTAPASGSVDRAGLLAIDRNGGWILRVDPEKHTARPWLNLYDLQGRNLRELLASFPEPRRMPYISIEGLAMDPAGALWLVDDPAIPEGWRASALIRVANPPTGPLLTR